MSTGRWLIALLLAAVLASPAFAVPAPLSEQELTDKSDLVATVRVLSVTCTSLSKDADTGQELPTYLAKLRLLDVKKGDAQQGQEILVTWKEVPKGVTGPWAVEYYPGEVVLTHLVKKSGGVSYGSTWWNAKGDDVKPPASTTLPTEPGQTVTPPDQSGPEHAL